MTIHCLRKNGHVLVPNMSPDEVSAEFELKILLHLGWQQSVLTEIEIAGIKKTLQQENN